MPAGVDMKGSAKRNKRFVAGTKVGSLLGRLCLSCTMLCRLVRGMWVADMQLETVPPAASK